MGIKRKIQNNIQQRKIEVIFTNERLITPSGLSIVGGLLKKRYLFSRLQGQYDLRNLLKLTIYI